jgi:VWFA-related protein
MVASNRPETSCALRIGALLFSAAAALALLNIPILLAGQTTSTKASSAAVPPPANRLITLDVVVTDHTGKPVPNLQQADFTLLDNKQPQTIVSFAAIDAAHKAADPPQAVVVLDSLNNSNTSVAVLKVQLKLYFQQHGGELPLLTFLAYFPDTAKEQPVATRDGNALVRYLDANNSGQSGLLRSQVDAGEAERTVASLRTLEQLTTAEALVPGRKLLIWLGSGWPLIEGEGFELSPKGQAVLFRNAVGLSNSLRKSDITVYNVGLDREADQTLDYEHFLKGVASPNKVQYGNLALDVLAIQTGGLVLKYNSDVVGSLEKCVEDAATYYVVSFAAPPARHPDEYHSLQVKIRDPGLTARTRTGYYDQP